MLNRTKILLIISILLITACGGMSMAQVKPADCQTEKYFKILQGKKIGVVANASSVVGNTNIVDTLLRSGIVIKVVFSPEHGFRLKEEAGVISYDYTDPQTGLRVISLYGIKKKPAAMAALAPSWRAAHGEPKLRRTRASRKRKRRPPRRRSQKKEAELSA